MNQKNGERFAVVVGSSGSIGRAISEALRAEQQSYQMAETHRDFCSARLRSKGGPIE